MSKACCESDNDCCSIDTSCPNPDSIRETIKPSPCCSSKPPWIIGSLETPQGKVDRISTCLDKSDNRGLFWARVSNSFRSNYSIPPGLYAIGQADQNSPVLVSANYKLSFDILRRELPNLNAWILVLDTKGINVWCAAGKGTFGTPELIERIRNVNLESYIDHKKVIIPQLGATGVSAHQVKKATGFTVLFGPVYAKDLIKYIDNGMKADQAMRIIHFTFWDRLVLTPMEISLSLKKLGLFLLLVVIIFGLEPHGIIFEKAFMEGSLFALLGFGSLVAGAIFTPAFLPFIPFRPFSLKGFIPGLILVLGIVFGIKNNLTTNLYLQIAMILIFPAISSYFALNFTGCTTFTSISGVKKEMKIAIPSLIIALSLGTIALLLYKLTSWGVI